MSTRDADPHKVFSSWEAAWRTPLGALSPLWAVYAAAAATGAAMWWASRWMRLVDLEAEPAAEAPPEPEPEPVAPEPEAAPPQAEVEADPRPEPEPAPAKRAPRKTAAPKVDPEA